MIPLFGRMAVASALAVIVAACSTATMPVGEPIFVGPAAAEVPFPECQVEAFAFVGETSLAAIGLADGFAGPDANRVGKVWVTAGPGRWDQVGGGPAMGGGRVVCVEFPDGSGMSTTIDDGWQPPGTEIVETTSPAWPVIGVVAVFVVLLGVALLAFRRG